MINHNKGNQPPIITTVILSGGQGQRMGGKDKGLVLLNEQPLVLHVIARLLNQTQATNHILISANPHLGDYQKLGGMLAALDYLPHATNRVQFVSCDAPLIPFNLIEKLYHPYQNCYPYTELRAHYCHAQCQVQDLYQIKEILNNSHRKLSAFLQQINAQPILFEDDADFLNYNDPFPC